MTLAYTLPRVIRARLEDALRGLRNADACMALAEFLARVQAAPGTLGRAFPVDRRALARHQDLDLTEDQVRAATEVLERVGYLVRQEGRGSPYRPTAVGLRRKPVLRTIGAAWAALFRLLHVAAARRRSSPPKSPQAIASVPLRGSAPPAGSCAGLEAALARLARAVIPGTTREGEVVS